MVNEMSQEQGARFFVPVLCRTRSGQLEATQTHNNRVSKLDLNMKTITENTEAEQRNTTVEAQHEEILKLITRIEEIECEATECEDVTDSATWYFAA